MIFYNCQEVALWITGFAISVPLAMDLLIFNNCSLKSR